MVALTVVGPWSLESQVFISVWPWPRGLSHSSLLRLPPPLEVGSFFARSERIFGECSFIGQRHYTGFSGEILGRDLGTAAVRHEGAGVLPADFRVDTARW